MALAYDVVKRYFPTAVILYDAEAMFSIREILKAQVKGQKLKESDAELMINNEIDLMKKADFIITVSENEKKIIREKTQLNNVAVWGHAIKVKEPQTPFHDRRDILFVGGFSAYDSPTKMLFITLPRKISPEVLSTLSCRLFIVGINPPDSIKKLSSSSIVVTGYVEDLRRYYEESRVFIVPHRYSAGIPWKLQEAMSYGIPSVVSGLTASQLGLSDNRETLIANNPEEFASKVIYIYQQEKLWYQIQQNSLSSIREICNPDTMKTTIKNIIDTGLKFNDKLPQS